MGNVAITYVGNASLVFALYHDAYCEKISACSCTVSSILRPVAEANGAIGQRYVKSVTPKSVYLNNGETVVLHEQALKLSPLFAMQRKGLIQVKVIEPEIIVVPVVETAAPVADDENTGS